MWQKGSSIQGLVSLDVLVNSEPVVGIKPGDSSVVVEYQVDELIHTWLVEGLVQKHLPWVHGQGINFRPLLPELGCEHYTFLDKFVREHDQHVFSILMDSVKTGIL